MLTPCSFPTLFPSAVSSPPLARLSPLLPPELASKPHKPHMHTHLPCALALLHQRFYAKPHNPQFWLVEENGVSKSSNELRCVASGAERLYVCCWGWQGLVGGKSSVCYSARAAVHMWHAADRCTWRAHCCCCCCCLLLCLRRLIVTSTARAASSPHLCVDGRQAVHVRRQLGEPGGLNGQDVPHLVPANRRRRCRRWGKLWGRAAGHLNT